MSIVGCVMYACAGCHRGSSSSAGGVGGGDHSRGGEKREKETRLDIAQ